MTIVHDGKESSLWLRWLAANAMGLAVGLALWGIVQDTLGEHGPGGSMLASLVGLLLVGAVAGVLQWRVLRKRIGGTGWSILGGSIGYAAGFIGGFTLAGAPLDFILGFMGFGAGSGLGQWFALRRQLERAWRWVLASALGFGFGGIAAIMVAFSVGDTVDPAFGGGVTGFAAMLTIIGLVGGTVGGAITGVVLDRLLRQSVTLMHHPSPAESYEEPAAPVVDEPMDEPGEPHAALAQMAGIWEAQAQFWVAEDPATPPMDCTATVSAQMIMDGRFLFQNVEGQCGGQPVEAIGVIGYDNVTGRYQAVDFDNMGTGISRHIGERNDAGDIVLHSSYMDPGTGETINRRTVRRLISESEWLETAYDIRSDAERKVMEIRARRTD
jgi:hypothetical protein